MRGTILSVSLVFAVLFANAQVINIGGIINQYSKVTSIDFCNNTVSVSTVAPFSVGQKVLLIQMTGIDMNTSNSSSYGNVDDYLAAGNYELCEILSISGTTIEFKFALTRYYDPLLGAVQLVTIPVYNSADIVTTLSCQAWDGTTGGVLILKANKRLIFDAPIITTGLGFRGGDTTTKPAGYCYNFGIGGFTAYSAGYADFPDAAMKGEGIFTPDTNFWRARGANANGGGGGNCHNTGGGGGANFGAGGQGGERKNASLISCPGIAPGIGGYLLAYNNSSRKVFLGGGGGAGDENNHGVGPGGNGGAIVILIADTIVGPTAQIFNNGVALIDTFHSDGASGGGGGGAVLISASTFLSPLFIDVSGGKGGDLKNIGGGIPDNFCFGPGGGGGGGAIWLSSPVTPAMVSYNIAGGAAGRFTCACPAACAFSTNDATDGDSGGVVHNLVVPEGSTLFVPVSGSACCDTFICAGESVNLLATGIGTGPVQLIWSNGALGTGNSVTPITTTNYSVTVSDTLGCDETYTVSVVVNSINISATSFPDTPVFPGQPVQLFADSFSGYSFSWFPASDLNNPNIASPVATPDSTTIFCVIATNATGCSDTACVTVLVLDTTSPPQPIDTSFNIGIPSAFSPNDDGLNDRYQIFLSGVYDVANLQIFNRWGQIVFDGDALSGWDGRYKNSLQPVGSYVFLLRLSSSIAGTQEKLFEGSISLIR